MQMTYKPSLHQPYQKMADAENERRKNMSPEEIREEIGKERKAAASKKRKAESPAEGMSYNVLYIVWPDDLPRSWEILIFGSGLKNYCLLDSPI